MRPNRRDFVKGIGAGSAALAVGPLVGASTETPTEQFRAYWADAFNEGIYTPEQVAELVDHAKATNHNAIIAQVVRRADFFGNDALPPRTDAPIADRPYDPLATLVREAHDAGLEVHAWMNVNTMWNRADPPESEDHAFNRHGPDSDDPWISVREDGAEQVNDNHFFDVGHPDAADYLARSARSIVENYDVDGLNLDYVRYPDYNLETGTSSWGYNDVAVERFLDSTGRDEVPEADDPAWSRWRRDRITNLVRRIYLDCFAEDPTVRVSTNTVTYGAGPESQGGWESTRTYGEVLQNWRGWMEEGIVDLNVPMNYKREAVASQRDWYREWNEFVADHQYDRHGVVGSALYLNEISDSVTQIREALSPSREGNEVVGWTGYSYANPDPLAVQGVREGAESREELRRAVTEESEYDPDTTTGDRDPVFETSAEIPEMTWKTDPEYGHLRGTVTTADGDPVDAAEIEVRRNSSVAATATATGNGWFGVVDLDPGQYRVTVISAVGGSRTTAVETGGLSTVELTVGE